MDAKIDFIYLSSPEKLRKNIQNLITKNIISFDYSRIFLSTEDFLIHSSKETKNFKKKIK